MREAELINRVKVLVEKLGVNNPEAIPYCARQAVWQVNRFYIKSGENSALLHALHDNIRQNDRIVHIHYSLQKLETNICVICGNFCVFDPCDGYEKYGAAYEITVLMRNGAAERIILQGTRDEPVSWFIKSDEDHFYTLRESEVIYIESSHNDLIWHCKGGDVRGRGSLKDLEDSMPANFFRLQRGYIVNANHIRDMEKREVIMDNSDVLLIPFRSYSLVKKRIYGYLAGYNTMKDKREEGE